MPKRAHKRFLVKFIQKGTSVVRSELSNLDLYYYLRSISRNGYILKILGTYILVTSDSGVGITILNVPREYQKNKRGERYEERTFNWN